MEVKALDKWLPGTVAGCLMFALRAAGLRLPGVPQAPLKGDLKALLRYFEGHLRAI